MKKSRRSFCRRSSLKSNNVTPCMTSGLKSACKTLRISFIKQILFFQVRLQINSIRLYLHQRQTGVKSKIHQETSPHSMCLEKTSILWLQRCPSIWTWCRHRKIQRLQNLVEAEKGDRLTKDFQWNRGCIVSILRIKLTFIRYREPSRKLKTEVL